MNISYEVEPTEQNPAIFVYPVMEYLDRRGRCFKNESTNTQSKEFTNRKCFFFFLNKIYSRDLKLTLGLIGISTFAEDYKPLSGY